MYSRQEASQLKQEFWTAFGQYMTPVVSADGEHINWVNYKTGEKNIQFRMNADNSTAIISIELTHKDAGIQQIYFEQFFLLKNVLKDAMQEEWNWVLHTQDETGRTISKIFKELPRVSIYQKEKWPEIISFFKPRIIALDDFWSTVKYSFESLR